MKLAQLFRLLGVFVLTLSIQGLFAQGVTTSSMSGKITDVNGESLIGANILAVHQPTGTTYGAATDVEGNYRIANMRVGGPYKITMSYTGYSDNIINGVFLRLGEAYRKNHVLQEQAIELASITVTAQAGTTGQNAGASTQITTEDIDNLPTLDRNLNDFTRLTPQASTAGGRISIAGVNNRFNAIFIDGAVNNDVFGLAGSGTNGGQTGISPISIDVIDQIQVVLSPYDVTLGGFAGGGINAVTKSGTNQFKGTAYYFLQNQNLVGKTNQKLIDRAGGEREKVADFSQKTYGLSLGGPIVKDKVFFFVNAEIQDDETPSVFNFGTYRGDTDQNGLNNLSSFVQNEYGYDPGGFLNSASKLEGLKLFGKLDINLNQDHKLTVRHQYTKAENTNQGRSSSGTINFSNNGVFFPSTTNSFALELNSRFSNNLSNNLIIGYTTVLDDRDPIGMDFPRVVIDDGDGRIQFGSEEFSTANLLDQKIFTITNNLKIYKGNHTITVGTHNEFYNIRNIFIRQNFGSYDWDSVDDFINGEPAVEYDRSYSLVDNITGDESAAAADFKAMQLGFYAQDEFAVNQNFTLTAGLRIDIPIITDDPNVDPSFNTTTLPQLTAAYPEFADNIEGGKAPDGQLMFSPRIGFNYDIKGDRSSVLRGGIGIFTSRVPFVWPGAMFNNNGLTVGGVNENDLGGSVDFISDPTKQLENPDFSVPSGQVDLFTNDFKYPQVLRANLAYDRTLPGRWQVGLEGIYTKTLNNVQYTNINSDPTPDFTFAGPDNRPRFGRSSIDRSYSAVYVGHNTSEGYTYNLTATVAKSFDFGLNATMAYTYGDARALNEGTSSQNSSNWRGQIHINGRNFPVIGRSDFSLGHRVIASLNYTIGWSENVATTLSLFYNGQSGTAFSYVVGDRNGRNLVNETGSTSRNRSLPFVPASQSDIVLVEAGGLSPAQQWSLLDAYINDDGNLSANRGGYAEKNGSRAPFNGQVDFAIRQDLAIKAGNTTHKLQLSFDIFNVGNLINKSWGTQFFPPGDFNNYEFLEFEGFDGNTPTYSFTDDRLGIEKFDIADFGSRWRARFGIRYIFN